MSMTDTQVMAALEPTQADYDRADKHRQQHGLNSINRDHLAATLASHRLASSPATEPVAWMPGWFRYAMKAAKESGKDLLLEAKDIDALLAAPVPPPAGDAELREALEKCRDQFRFYEAAHAAKGNLDGDAKARTNCEFAEMCERALATHPSVPVQQGWLPIETAPKTGEPVLIWKPDERMVGEYMMVAYWDDDYSAGEPGWVPVGGVHKQGYASSVTGTPQGYPTHWMPLPATPPAQDQKGEDCRG